MGKQIGFYMDLLDEQEFISFVHMTGDVVLIARAFSSPTIQEFTDLNQARDRDRKLGESCAFWNRSISPLPKVQHFPQQGYSCIDESSSEIVEISRSKRGPSELGMGRLWLEPYAWDKAGVKHEKNAQFTEWYLNLCKWIKRHSCRQMGTGYVMPAAKKLLESGLAAGGFSF